MPLDKMCAHIHILALIKRQIDSCTYESTQTRPGTFKGSSAQSADTRSCALYSDLFVIFEVKKQMKKGGGGNHSVNTAKPFLILHGFLSRIFPKRAPPMHSL